LFEEASAGLQLQIADILRCTSPALLPGQIVELLQPGLSKLDAALQDLLRPEPRADASGLRTRLVSMGGPIALVDRIVKLQELNGAVGLAMLGQRIGADEIALTHAYTRLGEALGLDWAQNAANHFQARDQWERLLTAGLARDFEELRLGFLDRRGGGDPSAEVDKWVREQAARIDQFRRTVERARTAPLTTAPMLAQIATQARVLLAR
jgi:glutamate dehydrogenase